MEHRTDDLEPAEHVLHCHSQGDLSGDGGEGGAENQHATPSTQAGTGPEVSDRRRRACKSRRISLEEADSDGQEEDKYSNEMLQKRLRTLTDEKEIKKLKRLLRNRVSAQQARERKKQYINDLEDQMKDKVKEIQLLTAKLQVCSDENQALSADNKTLRRLIVTMRGGAPHPSQKTAPGASASRMGRPLRQDVSHGNVARSLPAHAPAEQYSSDSRENCLKVPQQD